MKKNERAMPLDLKLGKEMKSPAFKKAFQEDLAGRALPTESPIYEKS